LLALTNTTLTPNASQISLSMSEPAANRARLDISDTEVTLVVKPPALQHSREVWYDDGNLIIEANRVRFKVHSLASSPPSRPASEKCYHHLYHPLPPMLWTGALLFGSRKHRWLYTMVCVLSTVTEGISLLLLTSHTHALSLVPATLRRPRCLRPSLPTSYTSHASTVSLNCIQIA
jgi:hypothetical protein